MRLPDRRWYVGAIAVAALGVLTVVVVGAPVPAASGPSSAALTGPESVPHSHVAGPSTGRLSGAPVPVGGTGSASGGYTLVATATSPYTFRIQGPDGRPVTRFAVVHDKPMHLIVVRRDLSNFQHLHPTMAPDGTWTVPLTLPSPGTYHAYADFVALDAARRQNAVVLGTDIDNGTTAPVPLPTPATVDSTGGTVDGSTGGLTVSYTGSLTAGVAQPLMFRITRAGVPVTVQRYLGAYGHLTILRQTDLGYLHVHPEPGLVGGAAKFWVAAPSTGTFRMFLNFQVDNVIHTVAFTVVVS